MEFCEEQFYWSTIFDNMMCDKTQQEITFGFHCIVMMSKNYLYLIKHKTNTTS